MATKRCSKCGIEKELSEFHKHKEFRDGHQYVCKECTASKARIYYQTHKGKRRKYLKKRKQEILKQARIYRKEHKAEIAKYQQEYQQTHKTEITKRKYEYNRAHKPERQEYLKTHKKYIAKRYKKYTLTPNGKVAIKRRSHKRRAQIKTTENTLTLNQWNKILSMQNNRCNICNKRFTVKRPPTTDHIIPLSKNGGLTFENVQALCQSCNSRKYNKSDTQFIQTWL